MESADSKLSVLKSRFGYDSFWGQQEAVIDNVLAGRNSLALMPTGGGKSLCYQLPALVLDGITLVISPLIALMKDQVDSLNANGIAARFINSSLPASEIEDIQEQATRGRVKILYAAPERLALPGFRRFLKDVHLSLIAIDEAHCISEWGHEFRPDYRNLHQLRGDFPSVPVIALTATATERVRQDIINQLDLQDGQVFLSSFDRTNLRYSVQPKRNSREELTTLLEEKESLPAIIYCFSRQETEDIAGYLNAKGLSARPYHAGLDRDTRTRNQEDFVRDRIPVIVATIAFGMGINKPDIRLVVHYSLPRSLEGYYQETGRAGRDGMPSDCVLFFAYSDKARQEYFINQMNDASEQRNARQKLAKMVEFAQLPTCRRKFLLEYFGERRIEETCSGCDVCLETREEFDATEIAQKILSAVIRTGERFGANHVIQVLTGSREKRILELGHDRLSVYGIVKEVRRPQLREIIGHLQARGLLGTGSGDYPTLAVSPEGRAFLQNRQTLTLPQPKTTGAGDARGTAFGRSAPGSSTAEYDEKLFEELRALRKRLADDRDVPPFVVFSDASLRQMAGVLPQSLEEFSSVHGVGNTKLEQYGADFVDTIRKYLEINYTPAQREAWATRKSPADEPRTRRREGPGRYLGATYDETKDLLSHGLSIGEIALQRGLAENTIIAHLERMSGRGEPLDLQSVMPPAERLAEIEEAFNVCGSVFLRLVWEFLGDQFAYDEIRLARIYLLQEGRLPDQSV